MKKNKILVLLIIVGCCGNWKSNAQNILLNYTAHERTQYLDQYSDILISTPFSN